MLVVNLGIGIIIIIIIINIMCCLFYFLFVFGYKTRKSLLRLPFWARSKPALGVYSLGPLISSFLWVSKTQPNHWTKRMASTQLATQDPRTCPGPEDWSIT